MQNSAALFGEETGKLMIGDFFWQRTRPYLWGFMAGYGTWAGINLNTAAIHLSSELADPNQYGSSANQPTAAFCLFTGSYMADWYAEANNFLRSMLTLPDYGLVSVWTKEGLWRLDCMGIGEHVGMSLVRMINAQRGRPDATSGDANRLRELVVLGDPTLRAHTIARPSNLTYVASPEQTLSWTGNEPNVAGYYVYRASSYDGPFVRISQDLVTTTSVPVDSAPSASNVYLVKAVKTVTTGNGSYQNLSLGAYLPQP